MTTQVLTALLVNTAVFSALFGLMLPLRGLLQKRVSTVLQYALWAVVILKLALPFGFESDLSLFGPLEALPPAAAVQADAYVPYEPLDNEIQTLPERAAQLPSTPAHQADTAVSHDTATPASPPAQPLAWTDWTLIAWALGALSVGTVQALCALNLRRRAQHARLPLPGRIALMAAACAGELGLRRRVQVVMQSALKAPVAMGVLRPLLVLPEDAQQRTDEQLRHICLHELTHIRYGDLFALALMGTLRALYWFNPLVWLCFALVRRDMEAACDTRVLRHIGMNARQCYIGTVLHFAGREKERGLQAAMGMADGRMTMERRIRGMFRQTRTGMRARVLALSVAALMLAVSALTACQPTPEAPVVVNRNEGVLENAIAATPAPTARYDVPETWTVDAFNATGKLSVRIDAQVEVPDTLEFPVYEFVPGRFTQQQVDSIIDYFYGDAPLYEASQPLTKAELTERLVRAKRDYQECLDGALNEAGNLKYDSSPEDLLESIRNLEEQIQAAPESNETRVSDGKLKQETLDVYQFETLYVAPDLAQKDTRYLSVGNSLSSGGGPSSSDIMLINGPRYYPTADTQDAAQAPGIQTTPGQAARLVQDMLDGFGLGCMEAARVLPGQVIESGEVVRNDLKGGYRVECLRRAGDFLVTTMSDGVAYSKDTGNLTSEEMREIYAYAWPPEELNVYVDDSGVTAIEWHSYGEIASTVTENVPLLPFGGLETLLKNNLAAQYAWMEDDTERKAEAAEITVTRVALGMARVVVKDAPGAWQLVPAWEFYGTYTSQDGDGAAYTVDYTTRSLATINAVDGSAIQ